METDAPGALLTDTQDAAAERSYLLDLVNRLTGERNALVGRVNDLTGERNHLVGQVNGLTAERNALAGQINTLTAERNALAGQVNTLTAERNALVGQVNSLTAERNTLVGQVNTLTAERNALVGEVNGLVGRLNALSQNLREAETLLEARDHQLQLLSASGQNRREPSRMLDLDIVSSRLRVLEDRGRRGVDVDQALANLRTIAIESETLSCIDPSKINERLASLPFSFNEAIHFLGLTRVVNQRVQDGYYRDRLVILVTQEKSSSTLHEVAIMQMLLHSGGQKTIVPIPRNLTSGPTSLGGGAAFHYGMLLYFPNGGVCRGVFQADRQNRWLLGDLGCRQIVLMRHPADRMVAQYCMRHGELSAEQIIRDQEKVFQDIFRGVDLPRTVDCLRANLEWMAGWVGVRTDERLLIVKYEDMMKDLTVHFAGIHDFLYAKPMGATLEAILRETFSRSSEGGDLQPGDRTKRVYAEGYSGKVGVWRDYLTKANIDTYNRVVERFLDSNAHAEELLRLYPDLLLTPGDVGTDVPSHGGASSGDCQGN